MTDNYIKSPLNYIGGKGKILKQLLPLFPDKINNFVDLFCGGLSVGINVNANKIYANDNLVYLIEMYKTFQKYDIYHILSYIEKTIEGLELSKTNEEGYNELRKDYNTDRNPLDLFILTCFSFNHQIRFNNNHELNISFGKDRSAYNNSIEKKLIKFVNTIKEKNIILTSFDFDVFDFEKFNLNDLFYIDPPYLVSLGTYNDGKRGFTGWNQYQEIKLLSYINKIDMKGIKFALSNVIEHKGEKNQLLSNWLDDNPRYNIHYIDSDYTNSNYQKKDKTSKSVEVLITNH